MDHAEALELLAGAAAEPASLRAALEGTDPIWRSLREHLATCDPCARDSLAWLNLARAVAAAPPDAEPVGRAPAALKDSTLALVRAAGIDRRAQAAGAPAGGEVPASGPGPAPQGARPASLGSWGIAGSAAGRPGQRAVAAGSIELAGRPRRRWLWPAAAGIAAAVAIVALVGTLAVTGDLNRQLQAARGERAELAQVATTVDSLMQAQDHQVVVLDRVDGTGSGGSVIWSPTSGTLVVLSQTLPPPPAGMTYRCWVAHRGTREPVGDMHYEGTLAYWAGPLAEWGGAIEAGDQFGVSLVPVAGGPAGRAVLEGSV